MSVENRIGPRLTARAPLNRLSAETARAARARGAKTWADVFALIQTGQRTPRCKTWLADDDREALRSEVERFIQEHAPKARNLPAGAIRHGAGSLEPQDERAASGGQKSGVTDRIGPWLLREDRKPRRRQRGEVYSTDDVKPPTRRVQRVVSEARLEVALGSLYSALPGIRSAYLAAIGSAGVARCSSLEARVDGTPRGSSPVDRSGAWLDFARRLTADQTLAIVGVAVRGESFRECERANRKRNGWAAQNVREAAQIWFGPHASLRRQRLRLRAWATLGTTRDENPA